MLIQVNGEERETPDGIMLDELIRQLALAPERLAVERNGEVVRRAEWTRIALANRDKIEIVHFVGGGAQRKVKGEGRKFDSQ